jgi:hypothetical protein
MQTFATILIVAGLALAIVSAVLSTTSSSSVAPAAHVDSVVQSGGAAAAAPRPPPMALRDEPSTGCHPWPHMGYSAEYSFTWGRSFMVKDEQECCEACAAHNRTCSDPANAHKPYWHASLQKGPTACGKEAVGCNVWTYCPYDRCFAFDIHNHSRHECCERTRALRAPLSTRPARRLGV